jgi:membrane protein YdbS with pleckstrin-like domain
VRVFDIYQHPIYGKQAVRRGFSWLAFLAPSVWAVRRGLGLVTVLLVITTTLMFDIAQLAGNWVSNPTAQILLLVALVILFGIKPGFSGYRWHARVLRQEKFLFKCTVAADSRRKALKAANDDHYKKKIYVAAI